MFEFQQKRKAAAKLEGVATPPSPTSFDAMVDNQGKLKVPVMEEKELPSPPAIEPVPEEIREEMREVERQLVQPLLAGESSSGMSGFRLGSRLADPFSDEYAMERSATPKPPVPPKIALENERKETRAMPGSFSPVPSASQQEQTQATEDHEELTYEEQLAIALSLSEAEGTTNTATVRQRQQQDDCDLRAAIEASLKDMDGQQAAHAIAHAEPLTPQPVRSNSAQQPLVDLDSTDPPTSVPDREARADWADLFDHKFSPSNEPLSIGASRGPPSEASDELYRVTPELTRARLATFDAQQTVPAVLALPGQYEEEDPPVQLPQPAMDASFHSAPSSVSPPPSTATLDYETPQLIDVAGEQHPREGARTPTSRPSSFGFDTDSDSETFASLSGSRAPSRAASNVSGIEVIDVAEDSDVDMLSEDGIATPDSWSEVGSRDGESEADPHEQQQRMPSSL